MKMDVIAAEAVEPAYSAGPLLLIAAAAVLLLLFLIIKLKLHAFVALVLVSLLTALATQVPLGDIVSTLTSGFGSTLASVALLVGLGAMLGRLMEFSGGAQVLADSLVRRFGERRAPLALGVAALLFGFPIFFDAGFVVFLPIVFTIARRLGGSILLYGLPVAGAFAVMHAFVPPHPGPVAAAELIGADIGLTLVFGLLIGLPTWVLGGYLFGTWAGRRYNLPVPTVFGDDTPAARSAGTAPDADIDAAAAQSAPDSTAVAGASPSPAAPSDGAKAEAQTEPRGNPPAFRTVIGLLLLPLVLIFLNTGLSTLATAGTLDEDSTLVGAAKVIGSTPVALLITVLVAMLVLGRHRGASAEKIESTVNSALGPVCAVILITGAGGMFGGVLRASGIGEALADVLEETGLPVIVAAFVISLLLRVAQGSATVALTTTAGLIAPVVAATDGLSKPDLALIVIAIAGGATVLSHVNDSGFWLVSKFFGMDEKTTLKTWTVMETLLGTIGFALALVLSLVL
ncbi:GntP family permease [Actinoplanes xinjiangensis]|uniref:GntP family gluconate:H+ symporter n=1 Tax=Actinoplanes xinjiangensis TaxID=512350 RepID=A0A316FER0_9ACTN|nr:SLC13 family permease [Actinoplanes xinjiangensis]PWK36120.1 GntP family gluconate:H+ symporter [Actinoplanes xinjiangensis]GIF42872.1 permease [Actinoplanes xinjiangensis]